MKLLKVTGLLLLACVFLTSCAALKSISVPTALAQPTPLMPERKLHEPDEFKTGNNPPITFYVKHNRWESPFNPHEVLRYWVKVMAQPVNEQVMIAVVGNPKIDWKVLVERGIDPTRVAIPRGEIAASVVFIFVRPPQGQGPVQLFTYVYKDDMGVSNAYVLDIKTRTYKRSEIPKQQQSCRGEHLKASFNNYPVKI